MSGSLEDDDGEVEEEEELLVHVEFDGLLDSDILDRPDVFFKVTGIDIEKPIMQIEEQVFTGEYDAVGGTALFFEEDPQPKVEDPVFGKSGPQVRYVCKTRKSLLMSRVFVNHKGDKRSGLKADSESAEKKDRSAEGSEADNNGELNVSEQDGSRVSEVPVENMQVENIPEKGDEPELLDISRSAINLQNVHTYEPMPGPSWAPDVPDLPLSGIKGMFEKSADHVSRLIAEQMTIASDINMQNTLIDSD